MASPCSSSMFTLTSFRSPLRSSTILSSTGSTAWQGPHHSAQKSTMTGLSLWSTSCSKLCSVTAVDIWSFLNWPAGRTPLTTLRNPVLVQPYNRSDVRGAATVPRPPRPGGGDPRVVGGGGNLRPAARAQPRRPALQLHGRADHGQQSDGRPPLLGPDAEGRLPALQGAARP